jgi:hypothetical protein
MGFRDPQMVNEISVLEEEPWTGQPRGSVPWCVTLPITI